MTHEDAGKYPAKHSGAVIDERIAARLRERISEDAITCAAAHKTASELDINPADVGKTIDLLNARIKECQLGLFGRGGRKPEPAAESDITPAIRKAVEGSLVNGRLTCAAAWKVAASLNVPKIRIAEICEALKIKISSCQLGAFK